MATTILLPFSIDPQLTGAQVGDTVYTVNSVTSTGGFNTTSSLNNVIELGVISGFSGTYNIEVTVTNIIALPTSGSYIFFSKDNSVNLASLKGYHAEVKFVNDSTERAELFSIGLQVEESSK